MTDNALTLLAITLAAAEPGYEPQRGLEFFQGMCQRLRVKPMVRFRGGYKLSFRGILATPQPGKTEGYCLDIQLSPERGNIRGREHHYRVRDVPARERGRAGFPLYRLYRVGAANHEVFLQTLNLSQPMTGVKQLLTRAVELLLADTTKSVTGDNR